MEFTLPQLVLFLVGFIIYCVKPSWLMLLWVISTPLLAPFIVLFSGITNFDEQQAMVWGIWGIYNKLFLLIIVIEVLKGNKFFRSVSPIVMPTLALFLYFVIHNILTHFCPQTILREILVVIYTIVPLLVFVLNKKMWPSLKALFITVLVICIIQLLFIPLNINGIFTYSGRYQELIQGGNESHVMCGTFTRSNMMADYLSIIYLFITIDFFSRKSIPVWLFIAISVIIGIPLLYAGSKLPVAVTIINLFLCTFLFKKDSLVLLFVAFLMSIVVISFLFSSNARDMDSSNEGLNRVVVEMSDFAKAAKNKGRNDESTFQYSSDLIRNYFWSSPFIGHGNAYDEAENAYNSVLDTSGLKSDATLAFYLVEYGILGLILYLYFQYKVLSLACRAIPIRLRKPTVFIIYIFFLLFALTERGLFDMSYFIFIFAYTFGIARYYENHNPNAIKEK